MLFLDIDMNKQMTSNERKLVNFVLTHTQKWREDREINYETKWDEYERLWLGVWSAEDRQRDSERSRVVTPAIQQAVESFQSEIEEATFGKGGFFDIVDDLQDQDPLDVELMRRQLKEDCDRNYYKAAISEVILNMSLFGTGIGELIVKKEKRKKPATQSLPIPGMEAIGTEEQEYFCVKLHCVHPRNFIIDPTATTVNSGMGCAVDEFVPAYQVVQDMEEGIYTKRDIGFSPPDENIEPTKEENHRDNVNQVRLLRYYGLVPRELLDSKDSDFVELFTETEADILELYKDLVEAVIVIADEGTLLKAEENPYMMGDRPVVAARCDIRPGRFWGRGVAEKGYNMQKTIDAQVRSHLDSVALTSVPMMGIDATRMPRGFKFSVSPGKSILTNGSPGDILMPLKFGETSMLNVETANLFERYLLQATGTVDSSAMPMNAVNGADPEAMSAALSAIIKRHRRTMTQFQDNFVMPLVEKTAWRYMQYDPNRYPVQDFRFIPVGTLGIIAREYEQRQYLGMMSTLGPESPIVPLLMRGILHNSSLANRDEMIAELEKLSQPDPEQQEKAQQMEQLQQQMLMLQLQEQELKNAQIAAETQYTQIKAQLEPEKVKSVMIAALTKNSEEADEFGQRVRIAELALKEKEINIKDKDVTANLEITRMQMQQPKVQ
jgi:hypothetical protein